jgi:hypothetical protein
MLKVTHFVFFTFEEFDIFFLDSTSKRNFLNFFYFLVALFSSSTLLTLQSSEPWSGVAYSNNKLNVSVTLFLNFTKKKNDVYLLPSFLVRHDLGFIITVYKILLLDTTSPSRIVVWYATGKGQRSRNFTLVVNGQGQALRVPSSY